MFLLYRREVFYFLQRIFCNTKQVKVCFSFFTKTVNILNRICFVDAKNISMKIWKAGTKTNIIHVVFIAILNKVAEHFFYQIMIFNSVYGGDQHTFCLLYTSPSPRD